MLGLEHGSLFGEHYKIDKAIGSGGMGVVYLAEDLRYGNFPTAIKVLYPGVVKTEDARDRFRNEIIISYRITHRNVVRAYEYFDETDMQAYAMEYVEGEDLQERMSRRQIPLAECQDILKQVAGGLHAIHQQGILHRDLKPENVILNDAGMVKIADFGVARLKETNVSLTQTGALVGTPKYFAPEYIETGECDARADIYALGIIGYEIVSGDSPFRSNSQVSMMVERLKRKISPLSMVVEGCPRELAAIVYKAMTVDPNQRYSTAHEMREDLELVSLGEKLRHASIKELEKYERDLQNHGDEIVPSATSNSSFNFKVKRTSTATDTYLDEEALEEEETEHEESTKSSTLFQALVFSALLLSLGVLGYLVIDRFDISIPGFGSTVLDELKPGVYRGSVSGLAKNEKQIELRVWRSSKYVELWLLAGGCSKQRLSASGSYDCGGATYTFIPRYIDDQSAVGDLQIGDSKDVVKWSLVKVQGFES